MWAWNQWVSKAEDQTGTLLKQEEHDFRDDQEEMILVRSSSLEGNERGNLIKYFGKDTNMF